MLCVSCWAAYILYEGSIFFRNLLTYRPKQTSIPEGLQLHEFTGVMLPFRLSSKGCIVVEMSRNFSAKHSQSQRQAGPARPWKPGSV